MLGTSEVPGVEEGLVSVIADLCRSLSGVLGQRQGEGQVKVHCLWHLRWVGLQLVLDLALPLGIALDMGLVGVGGEGGDEGWQEGVWVV